jgi:hypothetical protein
MKNQFYTSLVLVISLSLPFLGLAQKDVLVPYRMDNKFGLSDLKGQVKLKPQYDLVEPIGGGYFKYSNYKVYKDTINYYNGNTRVSERIESITGVLKGTKAIINNSEHRHFTLAENALLIGSEESYVSKNSNFYNLNGERLLKENVEGFRILATDMEQLYSTFEMPFITLYVVHYDRKTSLLVFDVAKQKLIEPLLNRVSEFAFDRDESSESHLVCTYYDDNFQHHKERVYFDDSLKRHVKEPYSSPRRSYGYERNYGVGEGEYTDEILVPNEPYDRSLITGEGSGSGTGRGSMDLVSKNPAADKISPPPVRKRAAYFQKVNDTLVKYGDTSLTVMNGQKIVYADRYSSTQRQPLIYTDGTKYGLLYSDSLHSELEYDSLRYIKHNSRYLYLIGKKENNQWKMGVLNEKAEVIIPMIYSQVSPGILELSADKDDSDNKYKFQLKQEYSYSKNSNQPLSMYGASFAVSQNSKMGLVDFSNRILLPIEYDSLWKNGLSFLTTLRADDDFYVYKKAGKYGLFSINYKNEIQFETEAVFPMIPVCRYRDYAGIKGFDLVQLATENSLYFCYAGNDGTVYYKKKQ